MIPPELSYEKVRDAEPNITVNPAKPWLIAGSAFTRDPMSGILAPIFVSKDGGVSWALNSIVPGGNPSAITQYPLFDITIRFGSSGDHLYGSTLRGDVSQSDLEFPSYEVWRTSDFMGLPGLVKVLKTRTNVDQPYIQVASVSGGPEATKDKVLIGNNDNWPDNPGSHATIDVFENGLSPTAHFESEGIDKRFSCLSRRNESAVRTAIHSSGVVYAIFYKITQLDVSTNGMCKTDRVDVVVVRDDNWGNGTTPFEALTDPVDLQIGSKVELNREVTYTGALGRNRIVASNLSIAVDPNDAAIVYVSWADAHGSTNTLHVRKSTDFGRTWHATDLPPIDKAINPALAVNIKGKVAMLYQQLTGVDNGRKWETHLRRSNNGNNNWDDAILSQALILCPGQPLNCPVAPSENAIDVYLGEYIHLLAVGKDFYGIFSASNHPDPENFPQNVTYQRKKSFETKQLFKDEQMTQRVGASIDPFFVHVQEMDSTQDFYVRDFTIDATNFDVGAEPSTDARFCSTSDVWNRHSDDPGALPADGRPDDQPALGLFTGTNHIFARVHRKKPGPSKVVDIDFYRSDFGMGSNYVLIESKNFTFDADVPSMITPDLPWTMATTHSSHACIAAEVHTAEDPILFPTLNGRSPGWDIGTDLIVINDNNKAQKNLEVINRPLMTIHPPPPTRNREEMFSTYAVIHNPSLKTENTTIYYKIKSSLGSKDSLTLSVPGNQGRNIQTKQGFTLFDMKPGESRILRIDYQIKEGEPFENTQTRFSHIRSEILINEFTIEQRSAPLNVVIKEYLVKEASVFRRVKSIYPKFESSLNAFPSFDPQNFEANPSNYINRLTISLGLFKSILNDLKSIVKADPFKLTDAISTLEERLREDDVQASALAHLSLINTLDAYMSMLQFEKGNSADVLQTMYLQKEVLRDRTQTEQVKRLEDLADEFIKKFDRRELTSNSYSVTVSKMIPLFNSIVPASEELKQSLADVEKNLSDPLALQGAHIKFLLKLGEKNK